MLDLRSFGEASRLTRLTAGPCASEPVSRTYQSRESAGYCVTSAAQLPPAIPLRGPTSAEAVMRQVRDGWKTSTRRYYRGSVIPSSCIADDGGPPSERSVLHPLFPGASVRGSMASAGAPMA